MFKVNNKDIRTKPFTPCSSVSIVNFEHVIAGTLCSSVSVNFEQVNAGSRKLF